MHGNTNVNIYIYIFIYNQSILIDVNFVSAGSTKAYRILRKMLYYDMIYLLNAIWLTAGGSSTVHIYTQTLYITTQ